MSDKTFQLNVLTPRKTIFRGAVSSLVAPAALGYLGALANHAPLITTLTPGKITFRDAAQTQVLQTHAGGLLEVYHNEATLLVDEMAE